LMEVKKLIFSKKFAPVLIVLITILIAVYLIKTKAVKPAAKINERVWRVETVVAKPEQYAVAVKLYGTVESPQLFRVYAPVLGKIEHLNIREGDLVEKGQLLGKLDIKDYLPQLEIAKAKLTDIQSQIATEEIQHQNNLQSLKLQKELLALKIASLNRNLNIQKKQLVSQAEIDSLKQQVVTQKIAIKQLAFQIDSSADRMKRLFASQSQAEAELAKAELVLERSSFIAPFNGYVAKLNIAVGDQVMNSQQLIELYPLDDIELRAKIPVHLFQSLQHIKTINKGAIKAYAKTDSNETVRLSLLRLGSMASASGIDAFFRFDHKNPTAVNTSVFARVGEVMELQLVLEDKQASISIPYVALYGKDKIYRVKADGDSLRLESLNIDVKGQRFSADFDLSNDNIKPELLIKSEQLQAGDQIMVTHLPNAINGLKVAILDTRKVR